MLIKDKLRKETTPKRVFSVLKLVKLYNGKIKKEDVYNLIQPLKIVDKQDEVKRVVKFSIEENFIKENIDGKLELVIDKEILNSIKSFRSFCSENIFKKRAVRTALLTSLITLLLLELLPELRCR